ncbi:Signal transduction histidine kinase involved in nitrogen fixation and metabolism regulation [Noviherbaspirillum humi]|uniref:histidine kinase n=1 Tax=Noviherbaspirillum humi TaxID=1688639 RepID=A0A239C9U8_9BURK|nr:PAS domain-containing sensor histidine kinase [Noviherbaspirillum humi]SNS16729.1 Signal transduction histidine kinase involved in nitrogen fixation and metabolism regulation [Noviherbaspirillum humi]
MTRVLRYSLVVAGPVVGILLFLLASASENSALFDNHYPSLLALNAMMATALLGLVVLLLARLYKRFKRGEFGSRLMARLVLMFALVGILPGSVIYMVSVQFVSRSIESWFDVRVESALEAGLNLGRTALDSSLADLSARARSIALELSELPEPAQATQLTRLRASGQMEEATIVGANGQVVATVGGRIGSLVPDLPSAAMLRQARLTRGFAAIEGTPDMSESASQEAAEQKKSGVPFVPTELRLRAVVMIPAAGNDLSLQSETRFLQLMQPVPPHLATNAEALRAAYSEYQERSLARSGLRKIYIVTLTLTLLLAIFGAIAAAFLIAGDLAKPLLVLAEGTKAVAEGNLSPRPIVATSDELGTLTQSFNTMTRQLSDARASVERNRTALENAKAYLESVLANMSAGVMVFDSQFRLLTCNESVERILMHQFDQYIGQPLHSVPDLQPLADAVVRAFSEQSAQSAADAGSGMHWQQQIEVPRHASGAGEQTLTLLARGSHLPVASGDGYVVVFDDISDVISAQRSIAWGEVARRLAHEIKNPLTPIQLSAERLQMKLEDKLAPPDAAMLAKGTNTIVSQVAAMKRMVDDFRDYAKTPPAQLSPLDLNALIEEVLHLYVSGDDHDIIHASLAPDLPLIMGDETQMRQVIHNLLQNAQDAVAEQAQDAGAARIDVVTEAIRYQASDGSRRTAVRLSITDNGPGFASKILARAFEPYVTSKSRGTGLGLAMVKKIMDEHGGRIDIHNRPEGNGAKVSILLLKLAPDSIGKAAA